MNQLPDDVKSSGFNEEVTLEEKHIFHILEYKRVNNPEAQRYDLSVQVKKYTPEAWNGIKDVLPGLGYSNMFVLHDPTVKDQEKPARKKPAAKPSAEA